MPTLNSTDISTALEQWADVIAARADAESLGLVGLISHGDVLARRLIAALEKRQVQARYGALDITLYRDDLDLRKERPALRSSYLPFSTDGMHLILVDDVLQSGRTARAALETIFEWIANTASCRFRRTTPLSRWRAPKKCACICKKTMEKTP